MASRDDLISKAISHALRHEPWAYELELDEEGCVAVEELVAALGRVHPEWAVSRSDVERAITNSDKRRHQMVGEWIGALYGHSLPGRLQREPSPPPRTLYYGTSPTAMEHILGDALRPMGRQYVHLSVDEEAARQVGIRKAPQPIVLKIDASRAHDAGVIFCRGNEKVWLADLVPARFVSF